MYVAPHGSEALTASASCSVRISTISVAPLANTLGRWKNFAAASRWPPRSASDQPLITETSDDVAAGRLAELPAALWVPPPW
jgi:hypothetical protein